MKLCFLLVFSFTLGASYGQKTRITTVGEAWAANSINTVVFRKNSLTSFRDTQFISYYNREGYVVLGKRHINDTAWQFVQTQYKSNIRDAHNSISIGIDGDGYLHMAWDHHNSQLHYCRSKRPFSLELSEQLPMTGNEENKVSYPEFYNLPGGNLLFFYRDGGSGNGNLVINSYDRKSGKWSRLQNNLIDGEGKRNAYWQACVDDKGYIHISWVWRETPDVASNHDMCYAVSKDGGVHWQKSTGEQYSLPVNLASAEVVCRIPQKSELINQTSMCVDKNGIPVIATYYSDQGGIPQYQLIYKDSNIWKVESLAFRHTAFTLSGGGTKQIPISRPQVICSNKEGRSYVTVIFRDVERNNKVSIAYKEWNKGGRWVVKDILQEDVGAWEPTYDNQLWQKNKRLDLFVQKTTQADAEGLTTSGPQPVKVLEYTPW